MIKRGFKALIAEANASIETISVQDALALHGRPDVAFVDVREQIERQSGGTIAGAVSAPRGFLEFIADPEGPMHRPELSSGKRLVLFCASGGRSTLAVKTLTDMGIDNVCHIAGGFAAWRQAGGPTEV
ncbi:rhodanese-like domain-containing protein [Oceanibacterium hippocampi]|uniref:Molybdopterin biosynthesis protein MoeB n=1 Tax=Oceanibacterium hippocampi TaxID=745714 RepID=A0A1Y5T693_9PROT|nr:rhodanese-like domain-containing protein [Oceanibacterium hippocampi]SLN54874.1 molybdopterin biosynthesis protein MoeB [Oceanibacterium hippocampi]